MASWYWSENGQQQGPCDSKQLKVLARAGRLQPASLVWKTGMPEWVPASSVQGLFEGVAVAPAPAPASPAPPPVPPGRPAAPSDGAALAEKALATARQQAATIFSDLRGLNFREEVIPLDETNLKTVLKDYVFWCVTLLGVVPLLIYTVQRTDYQLTAFALFFAALWGVIFKYFIVRVPQRWPLMIASLFATGVAGIYVLLKIYEHVMPQAYLALPNSESGMVSLFGFIVQVGVCEELCKAAPVLAYLIWKGRNAEPLTAVMVGVFSGLGFAAFENMFYAQRAIDESVNLGYQYGLEGSAAGTQAAMVNVMLRSLSLVFCHAVWSGILAYFLAVAALGRRRWGALFLIGWVVSSVLHGVYDWLAGMQPTIAALVVALSFVLFYAYMGKLRALGSGAASEPSADKLAAVPPAVQAVEVA
jgi:RsiW-degrading membrane proteinase PrsW (M82 family)